MARRKEETSLNDLPLKRQIRFLSAQVEEMKSSVKLYDAIRAANYRLVRDALDDVAPNLGHLFCAIGALIAGDATAKVAPATRAILDIVAHDFAGASPKEIQRVDGAFKGWMIANTEIVAAIVHKIAAQERQELRWASDVKAEANSPGKLIGPHSSAPGLETLR